MLLGVYGSSVTNPYDRLDALESLCADEDPQVARLALMWSGQAHENAGDLAGARSAGERALALCDDEDGPWTRALIQSQLCRPGQPVRRLGDEPTVRRAGAAGDGRAGGGGGRSCSCAASSRSPISPRVASTGPGPRSTRSRATSAARTRLGWNVGVIGQAELALAEGDVDRGLALYRMAMASEREQILEHFDVALELTPWAVYGIAATAFAAVLHGRRDAGRGSGRGHRGQAAADLPAGGDHRRLPDRRAAHSWRWVPTP